MIHFKKKTVFGNSYSLRKLIEFRILVKQYFKLAGPNFEHISIIDHEGISNLRTKLNKLIRAIDQIMLEANIEPTIVVTRLGRTDEVCILNTIFHLHQHHISPQEVLDLIDKTIGVYSHDKIPSIIRTLNPLFWFIRFIDFIVKTLFDLLQKSGFDIQKIEESFIGKIIKLIAYCISVLTSVLTILSILEYI